MTALNNHFEKQYSIGFLQWFSTILRDKGKRKTKNKRSWMLWQLSLPPISLIQRKEETPVYSDIIDYWGFWSVSRHLIPHIASCVSLSVVGLAMVVKWSSLICRSGRVSFNILRVTSCTIPKTCSVFSVENFISWLEKEERDFQSSWIYKVFQ